MKRTLVSRMTGGVVLAVGALAASVMPATAQSDAAVTDKAATPLAAMQRDFGLTAEQAQERMRTEAVASKVEAAVSDAMNDQVLGGAYYNAAAGKLVVGVTDAAKFAQVKAMGAEPALVAHSMAELNGVAGELDSAATPASVTGWYVDTRSNTVVVTTQPGTTAEAQRFVDAADVDASAVRVRESAEAPRTFANVIGGNAYYIGSGARCSVGFSVRGGFVTAGHCGKRGASTSQPSGQFYDSQFPGNDYAIVQVSGDTPQPYVNDYRGGTIAVAGSQEAAVGTSVCRSGSTTGWHCGTIQAKNQSVRYSEGQVSGLTRTNVCAEPGDSGGSFISGNQAQGMTSGGSGDCTRGGTTYFQPVNEALNAYGAQLLTTR